MLGSKVCNLISNFVNIDNIIMTYFHVYAYFPLWVAFSVPYRGQSSECSSGFPL